MSADFAHHPAGRSGPARSRNRALAPILTVIAVLPVAVWLWGFTVDDALITARVASHIARGLGPRFNPHGPVTDAVTPFGYGQLLALFGRSDVLSTLRLAKALGLAAWLLAAAVLGSLLAASGQRRRRFAPLALLAVSAPLAAWAVSGMETGVVTCLATLGLASERGGALALGVAAALRPELVPFATVLVVARARAARCSALQVLRAVALVLSPVAFVAAVRWAWFGRPVPLSFYAKPSDFAHGLRYALGGLVFSGLPWLLLATPKQWASCSARARPLLWALLAHFLALVLCGGDWMPLYRLLVPVLPCAALAAAYLAEQAALLASSVRTALGLSAALMLAVGLGPDARRVGPDRAALIARARPVLARDARIAALDVGWVGAASSAAVIDLAGVTDPEVAFFPGGHTSKRIPSAWLRAQRPTAIVLLLARGAELAVPYQDSVFARAVEQRVAELSAGEFRVRTTLALAEQTYLVLEPVPSL
jgi:hypothetical protein